MCFEWDDKKSLSNYLKHGVDFSLVKEVFDSPTLTKIDNRKDYGEVRFLSIGKIDKQILFIVHTQRGKNIRIISARKANGEEREAYYSFIKGAAIERS